MNRNASYLLAFLTIVATFFPYNCFAICTASDLQPAALILASVFVCINFRAIPNIALPIAIFTLITFMIFLCSPNLNSDGYRVLIGYLSLFVFSTGFFCIARKFSGLLDLLIFLSIISWIYVGLVQNFTEKNLFAVLINNFRTSADRGVTSLAPEPYQFGAVLVLFSIFALIRKEVPYRKTLIAISFLGILLLSRSITVVGLVGVIVLLWAGFTRYSLPIIGLFSSIYLFFFHDQNLISTKMRLTRLLKMILDNPLHVVAVDDSANDRVAHIFGSLYSYVFNGGIPSGFNSWETFVSQELRSFEVFSHNVYLSSSRVLSTIGSILHETGIFGLIFICYIGLIVAKVSASKKLNPFLVITSLFILFMALPISLNTPIIGALLGILLEQFDSLKRKNIYASK